MSHQWASRHQGHNLHILTGRTCLRTFSNWHCLAQCTDFILSQTALFSWLHRGSPLLTGKTRKVSLLLIWRILLVCVLQQYDGAVGLSNAARQVSLAPHTATGLVAIPPNALHWTTQSLQQNIWRVLGSWWYFTLILIRSSDVPCQHVKLSVSFEIATSALGCSHQGQRLAHNKAPYLQPPSPSVPLCLRCGLRRCPLPHCGRSLKPQRGQECYWGRLWKMFLAIWL